MPVLPRADGKLVQIVDSAMAEAVRAGGERIACRPGCTQCCVGVFAINELDVARLQHGYAKLQKLDPERAARVVERARQSVERLRAEFPGDTRTGILDESEKAQERFEDFGNDEACPVLDPETGLCDLYESRPMTCRVFGPPVATADGIGVCELCYVGASEDEIADNAVRPDPDDLEHQVVAQLRKKSGAKGRTTVAYAVTQRSR